MNLKTEDVIENATINNNETEEDGACDKESVLTKDHPNEKPAPTTKSGGKIIKLVFGCWIALLTIAASVASKDSLPSALLVSAFIYVYVKVVVIKWLKFGIDKDKGLVIFTLAYSLTLSVFVSLLGSSDFATMLSVFLATILGFFYFKLLIKCETQSLTMNTALAYYSKAFLIPLLFITVLDKLGFIWAILIGTMLFFGKRFLSAKKID